MNYLLTEMGNTSNQIIHKEFFAQLLQNTSEENTYFFLTGYDLQSSVPIKAFQFLNALSNILQTYISGRKIRYFPCTCALVRASVVYA